MSTVPLLLVAIFLIVIFSIIYLSIYTEYDERLFENRLKVMTEYMKRTNAEHPLPNSLGYVSEVDNNIYRVTRFSTNNLSIQSVTEHDDNQETFNFLTQTYEPVKFPLDEPRVKSHATDPSKYMLRGDDGWFEMNCPTDEHFDNYTMKCVPVSPCLNKQSGLYGMTESLIDKLVLNHRVPNENEDPNELHPTMYLRCIEGGSFVVEECPNNYTFDPVTGTCERNNLCRDKPNYYILPYEPGTLNANEYEQCLTKQVVKSSCSEGFIFDRIKEMCVAGNPCNIGGIGHTYLESGIGPNQFYQCVSNNTANLITCIIRVVDEAGRYSCAGNSECTSFENGTGTQIITHDDDVWSFNRGILQCDNYLLINDLECDTSNIIGDKIFNKRFKPILHIPKEVYDTRQNMCIDSNIDLLNIKNDTFGIQNVPNDYDINFETSFAGETAKAYSLLQVNNLDSYLIYARDLNALGINYITLEPLQCFGSHLYDIFEGRQLNICTMSPANNTMTVDELVIDDGKYFESKTVKISKDEQYKSVCAQKLDGTSNFVELDSFFERISTNILQSDPCNDILHKINIRYTTIKDKYTTIASEYTYDREKGPSKVERYVQNIPIDADSIQPLFDPFEREEIVQPLFNPFIFDPPPFEPQDPRPPVNPPEPEPEPPTAPSMNQLIDYSCFYSLPTHKLSACVAGNEIIIQAIANLRENIRVDVNCTDAAGLANVVNSYAYLGNGLGCKCEYINDEIVVNQVNNPKVYDNIETQSNDGFKYNRWIHYKDGRFLACPEDLLDENTFTCRVEPDKIYHIQDLQH
ncbi:VP91 [Rachiplusia nu nucleopolyhedrovirus]|uniref:VP91 n=1 Tax=Rachiplusia nu nucleopolyhedrovirus TaxID=2605775 RepID=A0AAF1DB34_9ABAC|nr:VP91 [Rachiplusia nu nucleopolyhedrovirus]QEI03612.1 VP91 [Rachiplusia nu nucleopolyhedrovirus]